jgi:ketosteroid isomerase-like protein
VPSENVATVHRFVDAFNRRDFEATLDDADPAIELHEWPNAPGAQVYRGHDGVLEAVGNWFETWEWMQIEIGDISEVGDRVFFTLHQRAKGKSSQIEVEITSYNVYTFRDGKVSRLELFTEREPALAAAGLTADLEKGKEEKAE